MYTFIILIFIRVEFTFYMRAHISEIQESDFLFSVKSALNSQDTNNNTFLQTKQRVFHLRKSENQNPNSIAAKVAVGWSFSLVG